MTSFFSAWTQGEERALRMLPTAFRDAEARIDHVRRAAERGAVRAVVDVIRDQNAKLPPSEARDRNVDALGTKGTACVVTGQQVGLFLGPLYTVYKAATAIAWARALERESGTRCVPIFWLQTEDHDVAEIDHCFVPSATGELLKLTVAHGVGADARVPVAHVKLGESVESALAQLRAELGHHDHAAAHLDLLASAYVPTATFGEAFAHVIARIFADDGLVVVNPRDPRLAALAAPVHARALHDAPAIADVLVKRATELRDAGFDAQVHVRAGAPLAFYSPDDVDGARYRLDVHAGPGIGPHAWRLVGDAKNRTTSTDSLLQALEIEPARFSTSALLRPLLQDTWLPTAAYVGGPAEMAYFAQLAPLYAHLDMSMPMPVPRARFRVVDDRSRSLLEKLGLAPVDLAQPRDALLAKVASRSTNESNASNGKLEHADDIERKLRAAFDTELDRVAPMLSALDPSLAKSTNKTREIVHDAIAKLMAKYGRALAQRDQVTVDRLDRVLAYLMPNGEPQERVYALPYYAARFGDAFVRSVVDAIANDPWGAAGVEMELRP